MTSLPSGDYVITTWPRSGCRVAPAAIAFDCGVREQVVPGLMVISSVSGMARKRMGDAAFVAVAVMATGNAAGRIGAGLLSEISTMARPSSGSAPARFPRPSP
jgi:hypothetical protein